MFIVFITSFVILTLTNELLIKNIGMLIKEVKNVGIGAKTIVNGSGLLGTQVVSRV